jgi:hypothetical protein
VIRPVLALLLLAGCGGPPELFTVDAKKALAENRAWYDDQVRTLKERASRGAITDGNNNPNVRIVVGPPLRAAWRLDGIREDWSGIVYDSTGFVNAAARDTLDSDSILVTPGHRQPVRWMFGDALNYCTHLEGPWWHCFFH